MIKRGNLIGFGGQTRVLVSISKDPGYIELECYCEGEDLTVYLDLADCKELVKHLIHVLAVMECNHCKKGIGQ